MGIGYACEGSEGYIEMDTYIVFHKDKVVCEIEADDIRYIHGVPTAIIYGSADPSVTDPSDDPPIVPIGYIPTEYLVVRKDSIKQ